MEVKKIDTSDIERAKTIYQKCFEKKNCHSRGNLDSLLGLYLNQELIGIAQIDFIDNYFEGIKIAILNSFGIDPEFQNQGYGDYFLKECLRFCQRKGAVKMQLTSKRQRIYAHHLYQKNGFVELDTVLLEKKIEKEPTIVI